MAARVLTLDIRHLALVDDGGNAASYKYPGSGSQQPAPDRNQL
jgi:hypothetical protein